MVQNEFVSHSVIRHMSHTHKNWHKGLKCVTLFRNIKKRERDNNLSSLV